MAIFHRILCPVDFSDTSTKAMLLAERLASETDAELILLHAFDLPAGYDPEGQQEPADPAIKEQLAAVVPVHPEVKVRRALHAGPAGKAICWLAQDQQCDLIVMGTHGRTGLRHLLLGSVAEYVLRHARCPVTTVRDHDETEALEEPSIQPPPPPMWM